MAFLMAGFSSAGANTKPGSAPGLFTYKTLDAAAVVDTAGYFNSIRDMLRRGDVIFRVTVDANDAVQTAGMHVVMTKSATAVDVSDTTVLTVTNTD